MTDTKLETLAFPCGAHNQFTGTKTVFAEPCNRGSYNILRGWQIPADENPEDAGYLHTSEDGHISWSPKATFEAAYKPSGTHIERMEIEFRDLAERSEKLMAFCETPAFAALAGEEQMLLAAQGSAMSSYEGILHLRMLRAKR